METPNCGNRRSAGVDDSRGLGDDSLGRGDAGTSETTVRLRRRHCASAETLGAEFYRFLSFLGVLGCLRMGFLLTCVLQPAYIRKNTFTSQNNNKKH